MDITALLSMVPVSWVPYVTGLVAIAAFVGMFLPAPKTTSGIYYFLYQVVSTMALNMLHAKNLSAPESTGIVGGSGAISAPLIATAVVPLATATPAQKTVTVPPGDPAVVPVAPVVPPEPYVKPPATPPAEGPKP